MRSAIILTILAIVTLSLAEDKIDKGQDKTPEAGKEAGKEADKDAGKDTGKDAGKDTGKDAGKGTGNEAKDTEEKYTDRYDNVNPDELIANRRLLVPYLKCVLERGRCTPEGKELKVHIQDAMQTACKKCTDKQKVGARKVVNHIRDNEKYYWEELKIKYDPKEEYKPIYEAFLAGKDSQ